MGNRKSFPKVPLSRDKVVVVTGGNTGIGYETAKWIAMLGAHVIIACRSEERALKAIVQMNEEFRELKDKGIQGLTTADDLDVQFMTLDCASLKSTEDFIEEFKSKESSLHLLILNAGLAHYKLEYTEDDFELMFQVNYLSQVLLSVKLLPTMLKSGEDCRIVLISSAAHNGGKLDLNTIQARHLNNDNFNSYDYYGNSKLYQIMFMYVLNEKLSSTNVTVNSVHPGMVNTEFTRYFEERFSCWKCIECILKYCCCCIMNTPYEGAITQINAAINPKLKGTRDVYFDNCRPKTPTSEARDKIKQAMLWQYSLECLKNHLIEDDLQVLGSSEKKE